MEDSELREVYPSMYEDAERKYRLKAGATDSEKEYAKMYEKSAIETGILVPVD